MPLCIDRHQDENLTPEQVHVVHETTHGFGNHEIIEIAWGLFDGTFTFKEQIPLERER